jgi:N6-adenosine-specific RNA methylase IME4
LGKYNDRRLKLFPNRKYSIIYADPPWSYNSRMAFGKGAKRSSAEDYYDVMTLNEICNLPVKDIADKDCVLFLWTTMPKIFESKKVIESWGFEYKTCAFTWVKANKVFSKKRFDERGIDDFMGQGRWTRGNAELCLLATKGNLKRLSAKVRQIVYTPIEEHSKKPDEVRNRIIELVGNLPRIELFARQEIEGWDCWGNEVREVI